MIRTLAMRYLIRKYAIITPPRFEALISGFNCCQLFQYSLQKLECGLAQSARLSGLKAVNASRH
jgi:hypothetical protein